MLSKGRGGMPPASFPANLPPPPHVIPVYLSTFQAASSLCLFLLCPPFRLILRQPALHGLQSPQEARRGSPELNVEVLIRQAGLHHSVLTEHHQRRPLAFLAIWPRRTGEVFPERRIVLLHLVVDWVRTLSLALHVRGGFLEKAHDTFLSLGIVERFPELSRDNHSSKNPLRPETENRN